MLVVSLHFKALAAAFWYKECILNVNHKLVSYVETHKLFLNMCFFLVCEAVFELCMTFYKVNACCIITLHSIGSGILV